ncbi:CoB--CoM heterodisulfide reductase iron-sulfur subunit B family protein [Garciella nitratireducens]|uniref:CoB--CoM heterodisulfide reductase iron-sulfur subunit B family protein n=1 Tax=Garciella nitratireducens TaxID=218205 RepID=UPI001BD36802|nr:CoB--CoM heterodisulfide reductase iron-sulfur subunit B family protein [Garciella nitratireducens]
MKYAYYPGCTLKTKAKELEKYAQDSAKVLGFELEEQKEWQCCGGVYPLATDEIATKLSSVRSLVASRNKGEKLVTLCSACHNVIKRVNNDMKTNENIRTKVNNYLQLSKEYQGETHVIHYLEVLRDEIGFNELAKKVKNPLQDRKIGAYYGCLLLRPSKIMNFDDPENPIIMEDFMKALGGSPIKYPYRTECCGGYHCLEKKDVANKMTRNILDSALKYGVKEIVTACPLCKYNLEMNAQRGDVNINVYYFTELLAEALGIKQDDRKGEI